MVTPLSRCAVVFCSVAGLGLSQGQQGTAPANPPRTTRPIEGWPQTEPALRDVLDPIWSPGPRPSAFPGFQSLFQGAGLGLNGAYPLPGAPGAVPAPLLKDEPPDWPSWLRDASAAPLPYAPEQALLVRHTERVFWRAPDEDAFVPLYHWDKVRCVAADSRIEVRQVGEFELLFHGSGRLVSHGTAALRVVAMDATRVEFALERLSAIYLSLAGREFTVRLPDGSVLVVPPDPPPEPGVLPAAPAELVIERAGEPGRYDGRAAVFHGGGRPVTWRHAFGSVELQPGQRVQLFLTPPVVPVGPGLLAEGAEITAHGPVREVRSPAGGTVSWCGARFRVAPGTVLRLDPQIGDPFAAPAAAVTPVGPAGDGSAKTP